MAHQLNATPAINAFLDKHLPEEHPARLEAIRQGACRVCLQKRPECLSSECPAGPRCHYREMANSLFAYLNPQSVLPMQENKEMVPIRTYEFDRGFLHLERAAADSMSPEEIEEMYGTVLSTQDGEMPAEEFFDLPDFRDI